MELSGQLTGIGLRPLVDFLSGLKKNGRLVVRDNSWTGTIGLLEGQIVGANFGDEQGRPALDAIFIALQAGSFEFNTTVDCERNVLVEFETLTEHLDTLDAEVQFLASLVTSLSSVPSHAESIPDGDITLTRSSLALLLALDGRRTLADHARERGLVATLRQLADLIGLGLVDMQTPSPVIDSIPEPVRGATARPFHAKASSEPVATDGAIVGRQRVNFWPRT